MCEKYRRITAGISQNILYGIRCKTPAISVDEYLCNRGNSAADESAIISIPPVLSKIRSYLAPQPLSMPALAVEVLSCLVTHPELVRTLQFQQVLRFLEFTRCICQWPEIVGNSGLRPVILPPPTAAFLSSSLILPPEIITLCWAAFGDIAATFQQDPPLDDWCSY
jgi:hypothetical protein